MSAEVKAESIPLTLHRVIALLIFLAAAIAWVFSSKIKAAFGISNPDTVIALIAAGVAVVVSRRGAMERSCPQYRLGCIDALRWRYQLERVAAIFRRI